MAAPHRQHVHEGVTFFGYKELMTVFLGEIDRLLQAIRQAIAAGDGESLHRAAHTLKGSTAVLGARGAEELARRLETLGREGTLETAAAVESQLKEEIGRILSRLRGLIDS